MTLIEKKYTNGDIVLDSKFSFRETLSVRIGISSEPISLTDPRAAFAEKNSGELCRPIDSSGPVRLVVEFDPPVLIPELPELALSLSLSGHLFGPIYPFELRSFERIPCLPFSAISGDSSRKYSSSSSESVSLSEVSLWL